MTDTERNSLLQAAAYRMGEARQALDQHLYEFELIVSALVRPDIDFDDLDERVSEDPESPCMIVRHYTGIDHHYGSEVSDEFYDHLDEIMLELDTVLHQIRKRRWNATTL